MKCPTCRIPINVISKRGLRLQYCPECQGLWFEKGMLIQYLEGPAKENEKITTQKATGAIINGYAENGFCPKCFRVMSFRDVGYSDAEYLHCVDCDGAFVRPLVLNVLGHLQQQEIWVDVKKTIRAATDRESYEMGEGSFFSTLFGIIQDDNPRKKFPYATVSIIALNFLFLFLSFLDMDMAEKLLFVPANLGNAPIYGLVTLVTALFLHAGVGHFLGNMVSLWVFGDNIEDLIGIARYLALYFIFGLFGELCQGLLGGHPEMPMLGASAAVAGIMGAYLNLYPKAQVKFSLFIFMTGRTMRFGIPAWLYLGFYFLGTQIIGAGMGIEGIGWWAHLTSFVLGYVTMIGVRKLEWV